MSISIETRLDLLERSTGRWKVVAVVALIWAAIGPALTPKAHAASEREILLRDDNGRVRCGLYAEGDAEGHALFNSKGEVVGRIEANANKEAFILGGQGSNQPGDIEMEITHATTHMYLTHGPGEVHFQMIGGSSHDEPQVALHNVSGQTQTILNTSCLQLLTGYGKDQVIRSIP